MYELLSKTTLDITLLSDKNSETIKAVAEVFGSSTPDSLHLLWMISGSLRKLSYVGDDSTIKLLDRLVDLGLVDIERGFYKLSNSAKQFLVRFRLEQDTTRAEQYLSDGF